MLRKLNIRRLLAIPLALTLILSLAACAAPVETVDYDALAAEQAEADRLAELEAERDAALAELERLQAEAAEREEAERLAEEEALAALEDEEAEEAVTEEETTTAVAAAQSTAPANPPAASNPPATPAVPTAAAPAASGNALSGLVTITDNTTPAVEMRGRPNVAGGPQVFFSADNRELGTISMDSVRSAQNSIRNRPADGSPPDPRYGPGDWGLWWADEFNRLRGLGGADRPAPAPGPVEGSHEWNEQERQELIRLINAERQRIGTGTLIVDQVLMDFAQIRADEGGRAGGAPHTRPNGDSVRNENWSAGRGRVAFDSWMNSPGHRDLMLGQGPWANRQTTFGIGVGRGGTIMIVNEIVIVPA